MPATSLENHAVNGVVSFLDNWTTRESRPATFVCGGHVQIVSSGAPVISEEKTGRTSPPVRLFWQNGSISRSLVLPSIDDSNGAPQHLLNDCVPVMSECCTVGGTLASDDFASSFHPAD